MSEIPPRETESRAKISLSLFIVGLLVLMVDQFSKGVVSTYLPVIDPSTYWYPYDGIGLFENFAGVQLSINHMTNTGAAWGILGDHQYALVLLRIGLIIGLIFYLFFYNSHLSWRLPLVLIIAGATGNVIDFFIYGHVVDMLHFVLWGYDFPVFNIADSAISIGITFLFILSFLEKEDEAAPTEKP